MVSLASSAASVDADSVSPDSPDVAVDPSAGECVSAAVFDHADAPEMPRPISSARWRANRANAQKSTGPKTPEGKKRASENALVHGLRAASVLAPGEDPRELSEYRISMIRTTNPRNPIEMEYVEQVIRAGWKLRRYQGAELEALEDQASRFTQPTTNTVASAVLGRALWNGLEISRFARYEQQ